MPKRTCSRVVTTVARPGDAPPPAAPLQERELVALWLLGRVPAELLPWPLLRAGRAGRGPGPDVREAAFGGPDGVVLCGDVEVHLAASDFVHHGHLDDPAYTGVVLHLVWTDDRPLRGAPQPLPGSPPQALPGSTPQAPPGSPPQAPPGSTPQAPPGSTPQALPGSAPQALPGSAPQALPGSAPQAPPGSTPQALPGSAPQALPGSAPQALPGSTPQALPGSTPQALPGTGCSAPTVEVGPALGRDPDRLRRLLRRGPRGAEPCVAAAQARGPAATAELVRAEGRRRLAERAWRAAELAAEHGWDGAWDVLLDGALHGSAGRRRETAEERAALAARLTASLCSPARGDTPRGPDVLRALRAHAVDGGARPRALIAAFHVEGAVGPGRAAELGWNAALPLLAAAAAAYDDAPLARATAELAERWPAPRPYGRTRALANLLGPPPRGGGAQHAQGLLRVRRELESGRAVVTIPQLHPPGEEAEVDFGGVSVWLDGELTELSMFVMRLSHSGRAVHVCFPGEGQEAFLEGHTVALGRLGGVPRRVRYDNLKAAVTRVLAGPPPGPVVRTRRLRAVSRLLI